MNPYAIDASICLRPSSLQQPGKKWPFAAISSDDYLQKVNKNNRCCDTYHHSAWKLYRSALLTAKGGTFITNHGLSFVFPVCPAQEWGSHFALVRTNIYVWSSFTVNQHFFLSTWMNSSAVSRNCFANRFLCSFFSSYGIQVAILRDKSWFVLTELLKTFRGACLCSKLTPTPWSSARSWAEPG